MNHFKKVISILLVLIMTTSLFAACSTAPQGDDTPSEEGGTGVVEQNAASADVSNSTYLSLDADFITTPVTSTDTLLTALADIAPALGISDVHAELQEDRVDTIDNTTYYRLQQYYENYPVYGRTVIVSADADGTTDALIANTTQVDDDISLRARLDADKAEEQVAEYIEDNLFNTANIQATAISDTPYIYNLYGAEDTLVYIVSASYVHEATDDEGHAYTAFDSQRFFVNARNGEIVNTVSNVYQESVEAGGLAAGQGLNAFRVNDNQYWFYDESRNIYIYDVAGGTLASYRHVDQNGELTDDALLADDYVFFDANNAQLTPMESTDNNWTSERAVLLMNNVKQTYDFFSSVLSVQGTAGNGNRIHALFDDAMPKVGAYNAYSYSEPDILDSAILSFGTANAIAIDTVAHEYTHAVEGAISNMIYAGESGALMEAYSDIFAEIVEDYADNDLLDNSCNWQVSTVRDLANPANLSYDYCYYEDQGQTCPVKATYGTHQYDPSHTVTSSACCLQRNYPTLYQGEGWGDPTCTFDHGYVHSNTTVISHAAYLMSQSIDNTTLAELWYRSLYMLPMDATMEQCVNAVLVAAHQMQQNDPESISAEDIDVINSAFREVGLSSDIGDTRLVNADLTVYAVDALQSGSYDNYHVTIAQLPNILTPEQRTVVAEADVTDVNGYTVHLDTGYYDITVSDNDANGSTTTFTERVIVPPISEALLSRLSGEVRIATDFRSKIPATDFTMTDSMVITLGELGVIEPVMTPADADDFTIQWSSSDESVVTVSPTGEAGILTALSKGTATITAVMTSGGNTITRTTQVRVASKARDTVLVLDVSGSMYGEPLEEMKESASQFCRDLLTDEYNNRVGIVFYETDVTSIDLTSDLDYLLSVIDNVTDRGVTNMEGGLTRAGEMLSSSDADTIKNIVIMADGLPNEGATSSSGSMPAVSGVSSSGSDFAYANAVIDTAQSMFSQYNIYSLGFFHGMYGVAKDFATTLMQSLTNQSDGYHEVTEAENLQFAFGDISDTISLGSRIVINIACPVDVEVSYGDEKLCSRQSDFNDTASFGSLQLLGENQDIKVLSLDSDKVYDVQLTGTGTGVMDYSVNYYDETEKLADYRIFEAVPIEPTTVIYSSTDNSMDVSLNIDNDGDGEIDVVWTAAQMSTGVVTYGEASTTTEPPATTVQVITTAPEEPENESTGTGIIAAAVVAMVLVIGIIVGVILIAANNQSIDDGKNSIPRRVNYAGGSDETSRLSREKIPAAFTLTFGTRPTRHYSYSGGTLKGYNIRDDSLTHLNVPDSFYNVAEVVLDAQQIQSLENTFGAIDYRAWQQYERTPRRSYSENKIAVVFRNRTKKEYVFAEQVPAEFNALCNLLLTMCATPDVANGTWSAARHKTKRGGVHFLNGAMQGQQFPIEDGETIVIGKSSSVSNIVVHRSYTKVSRRHMLLSYDAQSDKYFVTDTSSNGIYYTNKHRLPTGTRTAVAPGTELMLADEDCRIYLS